MYNFYTHRSIYGFCLFFTLNVNAPSVYIELRDNKATAIIEGEASSPEGRILLLKQPCSRQSLEVLAIPDTPIRYKLVPASVDGFREYYTKLPETHPEHSELSASILALLSRTPGNTAELYRPCVECINAKRNALDLPPLDPAQRDESRQYCLKPVVESLRVGIADITKDAGDEVMWDSETCTEIHNECNAAIHDDTEVKTPRAAARDYLA